MASLDEVVALLGQLDGEFDSTLPVVRLTLDDGRALDVFRAEQVRGRPVVWRIRGFLGDIRPSEFVALLLGTTDGRVILTVGPGDATAAAMNGQPIAGACRTQRKLADLAEAIAQRVRARFAPT